MYIEIEYINPITNLNDTIKINYPYIDYGKWSRITNCISDEDITKVLDKLLIDLNCCRDYNIGRPMMTSYPIYYDTLSNYFYYIIKFTNQILYNNYIDKLINVHVNNLIFEYNNPIVNNKNKVKTKTKSNKKKKVDKFIKYKTKDLFTGKDIYMYENNKTNEVIESNNPNLLDSLNKKKKEKTNKKKFDFSLATINFKIK